jgi:hypothetical protein
MAIIGVYGAAWRMKTKKERVASCCMTTDCAREQRRRKNVSGKISCSFLYWLHENRAH